MIKINLLPTKKAKKTFTIKVGFKPDITFILIAVIVVVLLEGIVWYRLNSSITTLIRDKQTLELKLNDLKQKVKEVENFEKDKKSYEEKIGIIEKLKKTQKGPVHILDEISRLLPDRVWIISLKEGDGIINLTGAGMTNDDIVKYVNNVKASYIFKNVQLTESRQVLESNVPVYSFNLTFNINLDAL
ncbi:MAG: PilN domain-containing protein [Nitrospira sp.]|nr:PilN domain-containing protein [Nitrospira sp.]